MAFPFGIDVIVSFALLSLAASFVNGGLGYGYSSLSTPLALLVLVNKIINPAYILAEAGLNTVMLGISGKKNILATYKRALPVILGLVPGIIIGSLALNAIAPNSVKLIVYAVMLPLIIAQAAGFRRPIKSETATSAPLGLGIGLLYSITTISGPPVALFWNNQGLKRDEFRAAVAQVRIAEAYLTCIAYYLLGLFTPTSLSLFEVIAPPLLVGLPLGIFVVRRVDLESFRRICMSFDGTIVSYGLSTVLAALFGYYFGVLGDAILAAVVCINAVLLYRFFKNKARMGRQPEVAPPPDTPPQQPA